MAGHSKWHNIQAKKGKADKARANIFTKLARAITVASSAGGGDVETNVSLRLAIEKAKSANMPKDNIERAIKRGTGELKDQESLQELVYEGYGPGGVALIVEAVTDNPNRTISEVKSVFNKLGGSLGAPGAVQWQFEYRAVFRLTEDNRKNFDNWDDIALALMDAGMIDVREHDEGVEMIGTRESFQSMSEVLSRYKVIPDSAGLEWVPKELISIADTESVSLDTMVDALHELDDVKEVYSNAK